VVGVREKGRSLAEGEGKEGNGMIGGWIATYSIHLK